MQGTHDVQAEKGECIDCRRPVEARRTSARQGIPQKRNHQHKNIHIVSAENPHKIRLHIYLVTEYMSILSNIGHQVEIGDLCEVRKMSHSPFVLVVRRRSQRR